MQPLMKMQEIALKIEEVNSYESRTLMHSLCHSVIPDSQLHPHRTSPEHLYKLNTSTSLLLLIGWSAAWMGGWVSNKPLTNMSPTQKLTKHQCEEISDQN